MFSAKFFRDLTAQLFAHLAVDENLMVGFAGENSHYLRFNQNKVRHTLRLQQGTVMLQLQAGEKVLNWEVSVSENLTEAQELALSTLQRARNLLPKLMPAPHLIVPNLDHGQSQEVVTGQLPTRPFTEILQEGFAAQGVNGVGIYTEGPVYRGVANNAGTFHWFENNTFALDYSLSAPGERAVKATYTDSIWRATIFQQQLQAKQQQLALLARPKKKLPPGKYRTYLSPVATASFVHMLAWHGISYQAYRQGQCALGLLADGRASWSPMVSVAQDFRLGLSPRFNDWGELSALQLPLITEGKLANFLVSSPTAHEYAADGVASNFASADEAPRCLAMAAGQLPQNQVLARLGTGVYINNLWYLNWSDKIGGRVTGLTRYENFWVENGEIVCPIETLRFDESFYHALGGGLVAITKETEQIVAISSYQQRQLGGGQFPGILVNEFSFTQ